MKDLSTDAVNHPSHYTSHPSGIECIQVTEHMGFNLGNAIKYVWRADLKHDAISDLRKAVWYIERELQRRGSSDYPPGPSEAAVELPVPSVVDLHEWFTRGAVKCDDCESDYLCEKHYYIDLEGSA